MIVQTSWFHPYGLYQNNLYIQICDINLNKILKETQGGFRSGYSTVDTNKFCVSFMGIIYGHCFKDRIFLVLICHGVIIANIDTVHMCTSGATSKCLVQQLYVHNWATYIRRKYISGPTNNKPWWGHIVMPPPIVRVWARHLEVKVHHIHGYHQYACAWCIVCLCMVYYMPVHDVLYACAWCIECLCMV